MNKFFANKKFTALFAVSCFVIILGVILYAIFGFNTAPDKPKSYTIEVKYGIMVEIGDKEEKLETLCEDTFKANGLSFTAKETNSIVDSSSLTETTDTIITYTFAGNTDYAKLTAAAKAVNDAVASSADFDVQDDDIFASAHALTSERFYTPAWRGAIALAVAAIVALGYVCIRYGVSCAVAGLACCAHDALFTLAVFAIVRFPVFAAAPVLYAAAAAFVSVFLWVMLAGKLREGFKEEGANAEDVVRGTVKASQKTLVILAATFAVAVLIAGVIGSTGTMLFVLPMLLGIAVPVYSTLFLGPEILLPIRKAFDKRRADKKGGYVGKKKAEKALEAE